MRKQTVVSATAILVAGVVVCSSEAELAFSEVAAERLFDDRIRVTFEVVNKGDERWTGTEDLCVLVEWLATADCADDGEALCYTTVEEQDVCTDAATLEPAEDLTFVAVSLDPVPAPTPGDIVRLSSDWVGSGSAYADNSAELEMP